MKARDDSPQLHRLEVTRDADGDVESVRFICDGDDSAPCHHWPDCDCETWGGEHGDPSKGMPPGSGHEEVQQQSCWMDPWFNDTTTDVGDWVDLYDSEDSNTVGDLDWLISGPITCTFEGDYMTWEYV